MWGEVRVHGGHWYGWNSISILTNMERKDQTMTNSKVSGKYRDINSSNLFVILM